MNLMEDERDIVRGLPLVSTMPNKDIHLDENGQETTDVDKSTFLVLPNGTVIAKDFPDHYAMTLVDAVNQHYCIAMKLYRVQRQGWYYKTMRQRRRDRGNLFRSMCHKELNLLKCEHLSKGQLAHMLNRKGRYNHNQELGQWTTRKRHRMHEDPLAEVKVDTLDLLELYYVYPPWIWRTRLGVFLAKHCQFAEHDIDKQMWNEQLVRNDIPNVFDATFNPFQNETCEWCLRSTLATIYFTLDYKPMCDACYLHCIKLNAVLDFMLVFRTTAFCAANADAFLKLLGTFPTPK